MARMTDVDALNERIDALEMIASYILFRDGFASNSTSAWSAAFP